MIINKINFSKKYAFLVLFFLISTFSISNIYVNSEQDIYYWDWGNYYKLYLKFMENFWSGNFEWLNWLVNSIRVDSYNLSSITFLAPFYLFFGPNRFGYILGISTLYMLPAMAISLALCRRAILESSKAQAVSGHIFTSLTIITFLFPVFWAPTLRGMPDVIGLIPLGVATLIFLRSKGLTENPLRSGLAFGTLLWTAFLFRRWYAFAVIGSFTAGALIILLILLTLKSRKDTLKAGANGFGRAGFTVAACLIAFQLPLVREILTSSYGDLYVAYQQPFFKQAGTLLLNLSIPFCLLFMLGTVFALKEGNRTTQFCSLASIITYLLFAQTQAPGIQHLLPIFFWTLPAIALAYARITIYLSPNWRWPFAMLAILWSIANFAVVFAPGVRAALAPAGFLFSSQQFLPLRLEKPEDYFRLISDTRQHLQQNEKIAIFASGFNLSDSLLASLSPELKPSIAWISQVDARDGFALAPLRAEYAIVADPVALHLPAQHQQVVSVVATDLIDGGPLSNGYRLIKGPYFLDGCKAYLFKRVQPLTDSEIRLLEATLRSRYPNWSWDGANRIYRSKAS
ncbi:hypothetical protein [Sphingosinicella xenopeptidilytica]|uniref:Glycosyltransferase RgtA/B/C/D-like domain-containing protein n=1 Tax=Sphingosinicella xenopeptidilytica TaxID=364098 RepID=A0ABW3C9R9_SPHXN